MAGVAPVALLICAADPLLLFADGEVVEAWVVEALAGLASGEDMQEPMMRTRVIGR